MMSDKVPRRRKTRDQRRAQLQDQMAKLNIGDKQLKERGQNLLGVFLADHADKKAPWLRGLIHDFYLAAKDRDKEAIRLACPFDVTVAPSEADKNTNNSNTPNSIEADLEQPDSRA